MTPRTAPAGNDVRIGRPEVRGAPRRPPSASGRRTGPPSVSQAVDRRKPLIAVLLFCFCFCAQWSGVFVGPVQLSDLFLVLLLAALASDALVRGRAVPDAGARGRPQFGVRSAQPLRPTGPAVFVVCIVVAQVLDQFFPVPAGYLTSANPTGTFVGPTASRLGLGSAIVVLRYALSLGAGWVVIRYAVSRGPESWTRLVAVPWVLGSAISGAVAGLQGAHLVDLSGLVSQATGERASGLAFHPNSLALYLASSIPFLAQLFESRARILLGILCVVAVWAGLLAADSRVALIVAVVQTLALPMYARRTPRAAVVALVAVLICTPLIPMLVDYAATHTRLSSASGAASDVGRNQSYRQALLDFGHSPLFGVGAQNGGGVPSVPLAQLAGGGLIAAFGFAFLWIWSTRRAASALAVPRIRACLGSGLGVLACSCLQNNVTDRGEYLVIFSAVCLAGATRTESERPANRPAPRAGRWRTADLPG